MGKPESQALTEYVSSFDSYDGIVLLTESINSDLPALPDVIRLHSWRYRHIKRAVDIFSSAVLITLSLIPGLMIAAAIALTSKGPVFYRELRVGRGGNLFRIWKFRSMFLSKERRNSARVRNNHGTVLRMRILKDRKDPRITPVGTFLRRWSLDELPQLLNVLRGDMSLIGPRPVIEAEIPLYGNLKQFYLMATPGLSGLWQVSGRSDVHFGRRAELDAWYVTNWSLLADFRILLLTIPAVLSRVGAR